MIIPRSIDDRWSAIGREIHASLCGREGYALTMLVGEIQISTNYDKMTGGYVIAASLGADVERLVVQMVEMVLPWDQHQQRLAAWASTLPNRFRASWARPADPWPDCLPPLFCETPLPDLYDGADCAPMFPKPEMRTTP